MGSQEEPWGSQEDPGGGRRSQGEARRNHEDPVEPGEGVGRNCRKGVRQEGRTEKGGGREGPGARGKRPGAGARAQGFPPSLPPSLLQWPMKDLVLLPISCHLSSSQLPDAGSG